MPTIEVTSNAFQIAIPLNISGNVGVGTTTAEYPLHVIAPYDFNFNATPVQLFDTGSTGARSLSTSSDGNTVVVGKANNSLIRSVQVFTYNGVWNMETLTIQDLPVGIYPGVVYYNRAGSRSAVSSDGTRIIANKGTYSNHPNGNVVEIFHKIDGSWVSKAFIHHAGYLGWGIAISGDGNTVAMTAPFGSANNYSGTLYIYKYNANTDTWDQSLSRVYDRWPDQVTLNNDGTVLALSRTSLPADKTDTELSDAVVSILRYANGMWNDEVDDITISPPQDTPFWNYFGKTLKFSPDGLTLAVGAPGLGNFYYNNFGGFRNAVFVYKATNSSWTNITTAKVQPNTYSDPNDYDGTFNQFGNVVSLNQNGTILVAGAQSATANSIAYAGKAYVFRLLNNTWAELGSLDGTANNQGFGSAVDITSNGSKLYVAARGFYDTPQLYGITSYAFTGLGMAMSVTGNTALYGAATISGSVNIIGDTTMDGNIGIGTTALAKTHIYSSGNGDIFRLDNNLTSNLVVISHDGNLGIGTGIPSSKLHVIGDVSLSYDIYRYPPSPMTGNTATISGTVAGNGTYVASASDIHGETYDAYCAFDYNDDTRYTSSDETYTYLEGNYNGQTSTTYTDFSHNTVSLSGSWLQLQVPLSIKLHSYRLKANNLYFTDSHPVNYVILGSTDSVSWMLIDDHRPNVLTNYSELVYVSSPPRAYTYFRIVISTVSPSQATFTKLTEFELYGRPDVNVDIRGNLLTSTINLGGVMIQKDTESGGVQFVTENAGIADTKTNNIQIHGNVGIGTTTPLAKTHIVGTGSDIFRVDNDTAPFLIKMDGKVGVGTQTPGGILEVADGIWGATQINGSYITVGTKKASSGESAIMVVSAAITGDGYNNSTKLYRSQAGETGLVHMGSSADMYLECKHAANIHFQTDGVKRMTVTSTGNVGIGTITPVTALTVSGTIRNINGPSPTSGTSLVITGDGDIAPQSSDARYKTNVEDLPSVLDSLMNVRAVSYNWKDEPQKWYGLLAQQVAEVFPEAAWHDVEKDTFGVHYTPSVVTLLLKAIQELKALDAQKNQRIQDLEDRVAALEAPTN